MDSIWNIGYCQHHIQYSYFDLYCHCLLPWVCDSYKYKFHEHCQHESYLRKLHLKHWYLYGDIHGFVDHL